MAIVGDRPAHGLRFRLERHEPESPLVYSGEIATPERDFAVRAEVSPEGEIAVTTEGGPDLAEKTRLLVRTVLKHAASEGQPPPRRIQRWRDAKDTK